MQVGQLIIVRTDAATQFRDACVAQAALTLSLQPFAPTAGVVPVGPPGLAGFNDGYIDQGLGGASCNFRIKNINLWSAEPIAWELQLWGTSQFNALTNSQYNSIVPLGRWNFVAAAAGEQIAGTGPYFYYIEGNDILSYDAEARGQIHLMLVNREVSTAKSAGDAGELVVQIACEPTLGW